MATITASKIAWLTGIDGTKSGSDGGEFELEVIVCSLLYGLDAYRLDSDFFFFFFLSFFFEIDVEFRKN